MFLISFDLKTISAVPEFLCGIFVMNIFASGGNCNRIFIRFLFFIDYRLQSLCGEVSSGKIPTGLSGAQ